MKKILCILCLSLIFCSVGLSQVAKQEAKQETKQANFDGETVGAEAKSFVSLVGVWHIDKDENNIVYAVDGRNWTKGVSTGIVEKTKSLYGDKYAEFLDNLEAYKYYPLSVFKGYGNFDSGEIIVSFKGISGRIDQGAGIAFNIKQNGDYLAIRANCLENNMVLWKLEKGKRSSVQWIRDTPTPANTWHKLRVVIDGKNIKGYLDDKKYIDYDWSENIDGKIGLWSKADSYMFFDDFKATPAQKPADKK